MNKTFARSRGQRYVDTYNLRIEDKSTGLPLQQIHRCRDIVHPKILGQRGILPRHGLVHRIRNVAIRNVPRRSGPQLGNVDSFGEIHLEQRPLAERQRDGILRILFRLRRLPPGQLLDSGLYTTHHRFVAPTNAGIFHVQQHLVPMLRS